MFLSSVGRQVLGHQWGSEGEGGGAITASAEGLPSLLHPVAVVCPPHLLAAAHSGRLSPWWSSSWLITCEGISQGLWHWCRLVWYWGTGPQSGGFHRCCQGQRGKKHWFMLKSAWREKSKLERQVGEELKDLRPAGSICEFWGRNENASQTQSLLTPMHQKLIFNYCRPGLHSIYYLYFPLKTGSHCAQAGLKLWQSSYLHLWNYSWDPLFMIIPHWVSLWGPRTSYVDKAGLKLTPVSASTSWVLD